MRRTAALPLLCLIALPAAPLAARGPAVPTEIAASIAADLKEGGDTVTPRRRLYAVVPADIDSDGVRDWAVNWARLGLPGWCGTGGCRYELWRGNGSGPPVRVFDNVVRAVSTRRVGSETVFDFDFHGGTCGTFGASECIVSFAWDAKAGRLAERVNPKGDGTVRLVAPVEPGMQGYPQAVRAAVEDMLRFCTSVGARPDAESDAELLPASVPDVDGDGARDWLFTRQHCIYGDGRDPIEREDALLITAGNPDKPVLFAPDGRIEISVATVPATILQVDSAAKNCTDEYRQPGQAPCPRIEWRWDTAKRQPVKR